MNLDFELAEARRSAQNARHSNNKTDSPLAQARLAWLEAEEAASRHPVVAQLGVLRSALATPHRRRDPLVAVLASALTDLLAAETETVSASVREKRRAYDALAAVQRRTDSIPRPSSLSPSASLPAGYKPPTAAQLARGGAR